MQILSFDNNNLKHNHPFSICMDTQKLEKYMYTIFIYAESKQKWVFFLLSDVFRVYILI